LLQTFGIPEISQTFYRVYQKTSKALSVSYTSVHRIMPCKSNRPKERAEFFDDFDHCVIKRTIHDLYSRKIASTVSQTFGIPEISQTFYPFYKKMQNITIIYERNACQVGLKYTWLRERFYR
jgi:hypothetical protein